MAATTVHTINFTGLMGPFDDATLQVQLRRDGSKWWARALWDDGNAGASGDIVIGTVKLQTRTIDPPGSWQTAKTKQLLNRNTNVYTDENYDPPTNRQVRAAFTASWAVSSGYPTTQGTPYSTP